MCGNIWPIFKQQQQHTHTHTIWPSREISWRTVLSGQGTLPDTLLTDSQVQGVCTVSDK